MPVTTREFHLKSRPVGLPSEENFELVERRLGEPGEGQLQIRNLWMSVDPYMRGRMTDQKSYIPPFQIGEPLAGGAIGIVEVSTAPDFEPGDLVSHFSGWRSHALIDAAHAAKIDERLAPGQTYLGALGVPGLTAYVGLLRIARVEAANTVFVTAGSGAVGSIACQIARLKGCHVRRGPRNILQAVSKRLTLQGFIIIDHMDLMPEFTLEMARWIADGKIKAWETVVKGLERAPQAFLGLFNGDNIGKMLVDLRD